MIFFLHVLWLISCLALLVYYYKAQKAFVKLQHPNNAHQPKVSVIVCSHNDVQTLQKCIPKILSQQYKDFELIVVNDHSSDATEDYLKSIKDQRLRGIHFKSPKKHQGKKEALSLGIQHAKHEWLLLTDADCVPMSEHWIKGMMQCGDQKDLVLGLGYYEKSKGLLNTLIQYDTLLIAIQYLTFAFYKNPYMSVGRNVAYKKNLFTKVGGFKKHEHIASGDDDLFIQSIPKSTKIGFCIPKAYATLSQSKKSFNGWVHQKSRHLSTGFQYSSKSILLLGSYQLSVCLFYLIPFFIIQNSVSALLVIGVFTLQKTLHYAWFKQIEKQIQYNQIHLSFLLFEILWVFLICYQLMYKIIFRKNQW